MSKQKFKRGDVVHIAKDLGQSMSHFKNDKDAIILGSYADQFGGNNTRDYSVMFLDTGYECSWYYDHQLTFLYYDKDIISKTRAALAEREEKESDLSWIVENWLVLCEDGLSSATMLKLMSLIGITEPWGPHGEGVDYYNHARYTLNCLRPVLAMGSLERVEEFVAGFPKVNTFIFGSDVYNGEHEFRKPVFLP